MKGKKHKVINMVSIVIAIIIILIVSIFSAQNADPVSISFFVWKFQASLAIVIFLCVLSGIIIGVTLMLLFRLRRQRKLKHIDPVSPQYKTINKTLDKR
jgi:putative membrane protein